MEMKGAIFDMDGLLFDTENIYQETWNELAAENSVTLGADFVGDICGTGSSKSPATIFLGSLCIF